MLRSILAALSGAPLVSVHVATLLFGLAGVLGASVGLNAMEVTFGRTFFASIALAMVCWYLHAPLRHHFYSSDNFLLLLSGALLAIHWVMFFAAIQYSTVAIGLFTFSVCPVFVALLEPVFFKERFSRSAVVAAVIVLVGVAIISGVHTGELVYLKGITLGVISGFLFALLQLFNRRFAGNDGALITSLVQNSVASILLLPIVWMGLGAVEPRQWLLLITLGVACTAVAHTLFIQALKRVRVSTASLIASGLEPVYGAVLAAFILLQVPEFHVLLGGCIVLASVVWISALKKASQ